MKTLGNLIYWSIDKVTLNKDDLAGILKDLGLSEDLIPRNDHKTALIRALRDITKGDERFYRRFHDSKESVRFAIILPEETQTTAVDYDIDFKKEVILTLYKDSGRVKADVEHPMLQPILDNYEANRLNLDANQLRSVILKIVRNDCLGVSMRKQGGIYFIDQKNQKQMAKLAGLFERLGGDNILSQVPIYDDKSTQDALELAINDDIISELQTIIEEIEIKLENGGISAKVLEGRKEEATNLMNKIIHHEANLRNKANELRSKTEQFQKALESSLDVALNIVKPFDLSEALRALSKAKK